MVRFGLWLVSKPPTGRNNASPKSRLLVTSAVSATNPGYWIPILFAAVLESSASTPAAPFWRMNSPYSWRQQLLSRFANDIVPLNMSSPP